MYGVCWVFIENFELDLVLDYFLIWIEGKFLGVFVEMDLEVLFFFFCVVDVNYWSFILFLGDI